MNKYLDNNGLLYVWNKIKALLGGKVDKVEGKGLSANDFTAADKSKLDGLENYTLPAAAADALGGVKIGSGVNISGDGTLSVPAYELTPATADTLGGVKVGAGLTITDGVLSAPGGGEADAVEWANVKNKPDVALKSDLSSVYRYKGSVVNSAALPSEDNTAGDVWNVEATGMNYAWDGEKWDALGEIFEIQAITNAEIDSITGE